MIVGELLGAGDTRQSVRIVLSSAVTNSSHRLSVSAGVQCDHDNMARVSLKPATASDVLTREVACVSHGMRHVSPPPATWSHGVTSVDTWDCVTCLDTWLHWLHPLHWVDTAWPLSRIIINTVIILIFVIAITIMFKIVKHYCCCCIICQNKKK